MAAAARKDLFLQVSGTVEPLNAAMRAGKTALLGLGSAANDVQAEVDKAMAEMGANAPAEAKRIEKAYEATFAAIRRNATAVLNAPDGASAIKVLDAGAAAQAAQAATQQAAALRTVAEAAGRVAAKAGEAGQAERVLAVAAAVNATQAEHEAEALREQARVLQLVATEAGAAGVAHGTAGKVAGQAKAGYQQLGFQLNDVATQYASGASASIIFAQQSGQVVQALQLIAGESKGVLGFLGGPWGIALTTAAVVLTPFVAKLIEGNDELAKAKKKLEEDAHAADTASQAQREFARSLEGAAKASRELNDRLTEQNRTQQLTMRLQAGAAQQDLANNIAARDRAKGELAAARRELQQARDAAAAAAGVDESGAARGEVTRAQAKVDQAKADLKKAEQGVADGQSAAAQAQIQLLDYQAAATDAGTAAMHRHELAVQAARDAYVEAYKAADKLTGAKAQRSAKESADAVYQSAVAAADRDRDRDQKRAREAEHPRDTRSAESKLGDMVALVQTLFPGARITSTTGGKHVAGSDHYADRVIDFVPKGGVGTLSKAEVRQRLVDAGVDIRRNAGGVEQLFGPGDKGHADHFHFAFEGGARSPDQLARAREAAEQRAIRDDEAYQGLKSQAQGRLIDAFRQQVTDAEALARLDVADIDNERDRANAAARAGVLEKRWSQAKADELVALNNSAAGFRKAAVQERAREQVAAEALQIQRDDLQAQNDLLALQGDLATSATERRRIALSILDNEERLARATLQRAIDVEKDPLRKAQLEKRLGEVPATFALRRDQAKDRTADPLQRYGQDLKDRTDDLNEAFKGVKADGLHALEDGLVGVISGTESVAGAFKKMANAIIADLARIAVEKLIVKTLGASFFGFADGGLVQAHAAGGLIAGPGSGTSDDILSWLSNGEFVVTAAATKKHLPLLRAINDNQLPGFATGGLVGSLPGLPSVSAAQAAVYGGQQRVAFDASVTVEPSPLLFAQVQGVAVRTVAASAEPIMAGAEDRTLRGLRRPSLPGAPG